MRTLVFLLLLQHPAVPPMTLSAIEAAVLENNPELRIMRERIELARAGVIPAAALDDSSFMYRGWGTPLLAPWNVNQTQHMFMFSQTVPAKGKRELRYEIASLNIDVAQTQFEAVKRDVLARARAMFFELLRNQDVLRLHEEEVALARQAVAAARIKYTVGRVPQQDVLKAQVAVTRLADHLAMFHQDGELARARLNTAMGRDPATALEVEGEYIMPAALPAISELQQVALENRPDLKAIEIEIRQLETKARLAEKSYNPDLSIGAGYMLMPSGSTNRNGYMVELSVNLPWLNRSKHDAEIREAHSEVSVRHAELQRQRAIALQQIQEALIRANTAARLVEIYRDTLRPQAQATMRAASAAYQTDQTDFLNLIESQNTALEVEYAYYKALAEFDSRMAELEGAIGAEVLRDER